MLFLYAKSVIFSAETSRARWQQVVHFKMRVNH